MSTRPLAEVTGPYVTVDGTHFEMLGQRGAAEDLARLLNRQHAAVVEPLQALLARARNAAGMAAAALRRMDNNSRGLPLDAHEARDALMDLCDAIDADSPGQWVPAERLKECQAVLADLREEMGTDWRARCREALRFATEISKTYRQSGTYSFDVPADLLDLLLAALEGREPLPAHLDAAEIGKPLAAPVVLSEPRLHPIHRGGYTGDDE